MTDFELIALKSGGTSLRLRANQETFHPVIGPEAEARILHVEQQQLWQRVVREGSLVIWDVGLGAAANAVAVLERLRNATGRIELHSFESTLAPLAFALQHAQALSYLKPWQRTLEQLMATGSLEVGPVRWTLHLGDFRETMQGDLPAPAAILYDPYSAPSNPEMWTLEHFARLRGRLSAERVCLLTNYTRSTAVRCTLLLAGFYVGIGVAIGEKEQSTIAANRLDALERPLTRAWLRQVRASQNSNPLREAGAVYGPMSDLDFQNLERHPQFSGAE